MKAASSNKKRHILSGAMGSARLELLCRTAIMQGTDEKHGGTMMPIAHEASSIQHGFHGKPNGIKTRIVIPDLSSEPSIVTSAGAVSSQANNNSGIAFTKSWAPSSFVDLKSSKALYLMPQPVSSTHKIQQRIQPLNSPSQIKQGFSSSRDSIQLNQQLRVLNMSATLPKSSTAASTVMKQQLPVPHQVSNKYPHPSSFKQLIGENVRLKIELGEAKKEIARLKKEMNKANYNINELRSMSGNKISEIPLADMIQIMQEFGSEVSGQSFQRRKDDPQPASIVRQFRRWNPDFLKYFLKKNGKWVPKLGKAGELQRRRQKREALRAHRRNPPGAAPPITS